jgi:hypothetical protein
MNEVSLQKLPFAHLVLGGYSFKVSTTKICTVMAKILTKRNKAEHLRIQNCFLLLE